MENNFFHKLKGFAVIFLLAGAVLTAAACGTKSVQPVVTPPWLTYSMDRSELPEGFEMAFQRFWSLRKDQMHEETYVLEAPHTRYQLPKAKYLFIHERTMDLRGVTVLDMKQDGELVVLRLKLFFEKSGEGGQVVNDSWIDLDGQWFHVYKSRFAGIY